MNRETVQTIDIKFPKKTTIIEYTRAKESVLVELIRLRRHKGTLKIKEDGIFG